MKLLLVIFVFLMAFVSSGQVTFDKSKISAKTRDIVAKMERINELMGAAVYYAGIRPEQYDFFTKLKNNASKAELIELTNHPNGVVRCYSFWALSYDPSADLFPIIVNHISDSQRVHTQFGCMGGMERVGDFFIELVTPKYIDLNSKKLDSMQMAKLDSLLIYTPNVLSAKSTAVARVATTESVYPRIRELVIKNHNQTALVTLARYNKKQDVELILNNWQANRSDRYGCYFTYQAISQFPRPEFMPLLEKDLLKTLDDTHYSNEWRELYKAIASYKNDKSVELLKIPLTRVSHENIRKYHIDFIFEALRCFKDPVYDDLLWTFWSDEKRIAPDVFWYLTDRNRAKAFELTKKSLRNTDELYMANINLGLNDEDDSESITKTMLDLVLQQDLEAGMEMIRKNIGSANVHQFPIFAIKAAELKDKSFVDPLLTRLENEDNPYTYLKAAEALIAYHDPEINHRVSEARAKNGALGKDWGGEAFGKLLKGNNIK